MDNPSHSFRGGSGLLFPSRLLRRCGLLLLLRGNQRRNTSKGSLSKQSHSSATVQHEVTNPYQWKRSSERERAEWNVSAKESGKSRRSIERDPIATWRVSRGSFDRSPLPDHVFLHIMSTPNFHHIQRALGGASWELPTYPF